MGPEQVTRMKELLTAGEARMGEPLSHHTTLGIGGPAEAFARPGNRDELVQLLQFATGEGIAITVLGSGSNCLVNDTGVPGLVISLAGTLKQLTIVGSRVTAEAGVMLGHMIRRCLAAKLAGLESLAGVPGTVGGAIAMNAGAFEVEISTHLTAATVVDYSGQERIYSRDEMTFGYRSSGFQQGEIIISADFELPRGRTEQVKRAHQLAARERRVRQPLTKRSAGSVFKNPRPDLAAGWLIDQAGLKGTTVGDAQISTQHANFFINRGAATADDMAQLIKLATRTVRERFDVTLEMEIKTLGFPPDYWEEVGIDG